MQKRDAKLTKWFAPSSVQSNQQATQVERKKKKVSAPSLVHISTLTTTRTDRFTQRKTLALAGDDDDDFARIKNGGDADGKGHPGDLGDVIVKEACVGEDGVVGESLDAGAGREGGACDKMIASSLRHIRRRAPRTDQVR